MKAAQNARLEGTGRGHIPYTESSPSSSPRSFLAPPPPGVTGTSPSRQWEGMQPGLDLLEEPGYSDSHRG